MVNAMPKQYGTSDEQNSAEKSDHDNSRSDVEDSKREVEAASKGTRLQDEQESDKYGPTEPTERAESVFATIRLVVLSFSALFAIVIGLFTFLGWRTVSDVQSTVQMTVEKEIGKLISKTGDEVTGLSQQIDELKKNFDRAQQQVEQIKGDVVSATNTLELTLLGQSDPVGDYQRLARKIRNDEQTILDADTRKDAEIIFRKLLGSDNPQETDAQSDAYPSATQPHVLAEVLYNAAGTASEFEMAMLASELAKAANAGRNTPEHAARMYRAMIQAEEITPEEGFDAVLALIESLDVSSLYSLHFVLSEAFNVAYSSGRLRELVEVLEGLKLRLVDSAPSYVSMLQAQIGLFLGSKGDVERSIEELRAGLNRANVESPNAWWMAASIGAANEVVSSLLQHPTYRDSVEVIRSEHKELLAIKVEGNRENLIETVSDLQGDVIAVNPLDMLGEFATAPDYTTVALVLGSATEVGGEEVVDVDGWHWFEFSPDNTSMYRVSVDAAGGERDPAVIVKDQVNQLLGSDDDGGGNLNARLELRLEDGLTYSIGVRSATDAPVLGARVEITEVE